MGETEGHIEVMQSGNTCRVPLTPKQLTTCSMTAEANPEKTSDFESILLAIAGHDLRQPLQAIRHANEFLGRSVRTKSELRLLRFIQRAVDRLSDQLDELVAALQLREHAKGVKLTPVLVEPLLRRVASESQVAALIKGISVRMVPTSATIESDGLLLGAVLRNLLSNAVKYTEPGGSILIGCRHIGQAVRIDVYDTGIGLTSDQIPRIFEAFTRLNPSRHDGLGIGLFIVRQAIGILGHRIDVASTPDRGSRFSILARQVERSEQDAAPPAIGVA
jgi:signal transduction histidine kinase